MKKLFGVCLAVLLLIGFSASVFAGAQDFTMTNQTGVDIYHVFVTPHLEKNWGSDILGKDVLMNGESVDIVFSPGDKAAHWDLRVEDKDGNFLEWVNANLKEISAITLKNNGVAEYR